MILLIDMSVRQKIRLGLFSDTLSPFTIYDADNYELLQTVHEFLGTVSLEPRDITGIIVHTGVGGFTSTRIATTVSNMWGSIKDIPVAVTKSFDEEVLVSLVNDLKEKEKFSPVSPIYSGKPNIGPPKKA